MNNDYCISFTNVQEAAQRIAGTAHVTPVLQSTLVNQLLAGNRQVYFKVEALQKTGSFKFRGALNAVRSALEEQQQQADDTSRPLLSFVTHSSGNHAQALAAAANTCHATATIVMPDSAPAVKQKAVAGYGAKVVLVPKAQRASTAAQICQQTPGTTFVHPSEDPRVIAGQGTVCLEMVQQVQQIQSNNNNNDNDVVPPPPPLDAVIIPVGGGGLAAGNIITLRALLGDQVRIVLAEPAALDDAKRSFEAGQLMGHKAGHALVSVADALQTTLGPHTWPIVRDGADAIITVNETAIINATRLIWERLKICIEPAAGVGVAVLLSEEFQTKFATCQKVGVVLCGGNVDIVTLAAQMKEVEQQEEEKA